MSILLSMTAADQHYLK